MKLTRLYFQSLSAHLQVCPVNFVRTSARSSFSENAIMGDPYHPIGDMPQNWAGAGFIRCILHMLILERGDELHLFEGLPKTWTKPGMETKLNGVCTKFGKVTMKLKINNDGTQAELTMNLEQNRYEKISNVIVHLQGLSGRKDTLRLQPNLIINKIINIKQ